jgi:predicted RNA polymerase sigma factor
VAALESWSFSGIPENPTAWLYVVAKNKARNHVARKRKGKSIHSEIKREANDESSINISSENISDSQLRALFSVCHPSISTESQIGLALRILCGFGIDEIANAFLTNKETINKRLFRAKAILREEKVVFEVPGQAEIDNRMEAVLVTLYLLYSEGYYSESQSNVLRAELCQEAMRLTALLLENKSTSCPSAQALLALMCFHSSRFNARKSASGEPILYADQDESLWNRALISRGAELLHQASQGNLLSKYHIEASIAYWHTVKEDTQEKWERILKLYDHLLHFGFAPIAALNRIYALAKVKGNAVAILEAERIQLTRNRYYFILLSELYQPTNLEQARQHLNRALALTTTATDFATIQRQIDRLSCGIEQ